MSERVPFGVEDGDVLVYRLFDVADAVDLHRAEQTASAPRARIRLESAASQSALEFPRPPLQLALGARSLPLRSGAREAEASARVFDYGVGSVCYRLRIAPGTPLSAHEPHEDQNNI
jgi:hypothetical protein